MSSDGFLSKEDLLIIDKIRTKFKRAKVALAHKKEKFVAQFEDLAALPKDLQDIIIKISADEQTASVTYTVNFSDNNSPQNVPLKYIVDKKDGDWFYLSLVPNQSFIRDFNGKKMNYNYEHKAKYNQLDRTWE